MVSEHLRREDKWASCVTRRLSPRLLDGIGSRSVKREAAEEGEGSGFT